MAIRTVNKGSFNEYNGAGVVTGTMVVEYDYDDAAVPMVVTTARAINTTLATTYRVDYIRSSDGLTRSITVPPGQTVTLAVPTGASVRFALTLDSRGRLDGCRVDVVPL